MPEAASPHRKALSVKQRHLMPGHAARAASQTVGPPPCGEGWEGEGLDAACRVFHHQRVVFTCHER